MKKRIKIKESSERGFFYAKLQEPFLPPLPFWFTAEEDHGFSPKEAEEKLLKKMKMPRIPTQIKYL